MKPQKLSWETVDKIRKQYQPGQIGYKTLAKQFGVHPDTIKSIIRGDTWPPEKDWRKRS